MAPTANVSRSRGEELAGIDVVRLGLDWRVLYEIDELKRLVIVLGIRCRPDTYRSR